ncbi:hypothetical protein FBZ89_101367 [Nitrospirillum amazonense]|uniref:Uncharacterized protein n=1 Tax=Nitrospirillum amazonense TaxID=28077 RepID=A0A560FT56_9PROT|nr:hypothetical protein [Nitrospirillum amazonense]TWB24741.1 hypothetical protein FBZ89_101367 [Nitrospirillum amazonense]
MGQAKQWTLLRAAEQCYRVAASVPSGPERDLWIRRGGMLEADSVAALLTGPWPERWPARTAPDDLPYDEAAESPSVSSVSADTAKRSLVE